MMGTVWVRLSTSQESIIPLTNAIVSPFQRAFSLGPVSTNNA